MVLRVSSILKTTDGQTPGARAAHLRTNACTKSESAHGFPRRVLIPRLRLSKREENLRDLIKRLYGMRPLEHQTLGNAQSESSTQKEIQIAVCQVDKSFSVVREDRPLSGVLV